MNQTIDFYITNPNHHWENFRPIILELKERAIAVRIVSLCEFRRMNSPIDEWERLGIDYTILFSLKFKNTSTSTGKKSIGGNKSFIRNLLRDLIWWFKLKPSLKKANATLPKLAVIPNDIAYPLNKVLKFLKKKDVYTILYQEGIRFPLPNEEGGKKYGTNGAKKVFTWGKRSSEYFQSIGVKSELVEVGNPRFDEMLAADYTSIQKNIASEISTEVNWLYASNPVDDQGFCTHEAKILLFERFLVSCISLGEPLTIWLRLHPREDRSDFQAVIDKYKDKINIKWAMDYPLFAYLQLMDYTIVLASTVGVESLLNNVPIAVIKLPNSYNYVFDYVESGAAVGLDLDSQQSCMATLNRMLNRKKRDLSKDEMRYILDHISNIHTGRTIFTNSLLKNI